MNLILVRGLPGSGKSTFAKTFGIFHVEQDMFCMINGKYQWDARLVRQRVMQCYDAVEHALTCGIDVVVSNTFTREWEMVPYINLAIGYGAKLIIYCMCCEFENTHNVPMDTLQKMKGRWEPYKREVEITIDSKGKYQFKE